MGWIKRLLERFRGDSYEDFEEEIWRKRKTPDR